MFISNVVTGLCIYILHISCQLTNLHINYIRTNIKFCVLTETYRRIKVEQIFILSFLSRSAARNTFYLKKVGVSHVLNTAEGQTSGTVDTSQVGRQGTTDTLDD